jgi:hypothetical protein
MYCLSCDKVTPTENEKSYDGVIEGTKIPVKVTRGMCTHCRNGKQKLIDQSGSGFDFGAILGNLLGGIPKLLGGLIGL